jgi:hypothetical protein
MPAHRTVPTSPADAGIVMWPMCAVCSMAKQHWVPVEGYSVEHVKPTLLSIRRSVLVRAECQHHATGEPTREPRVQMAKVDCPYFWGEAQKFEAIRKLVFFAPAQAAENRMLV